jgi:ATP-dependent Clp protease adaptor protein ClpS
MNDDAGLAVTSTPAAEEPLIPERRRKEQDAAARPRQQPPYAVVLFNDDEHSFMYVIETLMKVFGYPAEKCYALTLQIHNEGRGIVWSGSLEVAELKRDPIRSACLSQCHRTRVAQRSSDLWFRISSNQSTRSSTVLRSSTWRFALSGE